MNGESEADGVSWMLWSRYTVAILSIVAMIGLHHVVSALHFRAGSQDEELINISGAQRMLSQRILFLAERYVATGADRDFVQFTAAVDRFDNSHRQLTQVARGNPTLESLYNFDRSDGLDQRAQTFVIIARQIGERSSSQAITEMQVDTLVRLARDALLGELDAAVGGFPE